MSPSTILGMLAATQSSTDMSPTLLLLTGILSVFIGYVWYAIASTTTGKRWLGRPQWMPLREMRLRSMTWTTIILMFAGIVMVAIALVRFVVA